MYMARAKGMAADVSNAPSAKDATQGHGDQHAPDLKPHFSTLVIPQLTFGGEDLKLGIYGIATLDASSSLSKDEFAHVELGIVVALDIEAGVFKLESQLSPRSFVLAEVCPVAGVIAFYSWFKADTSKNIVAGDWVLSLGGYHQAFKAPAHYPRPPRLGIN
ncbi:hypothetical protein AUP68_00457 [Ilyonectria robusta]